MVSVIVDRDVKDELGTNRVPNHKRECTKHNNIHRPASADGTDVSLENSSLASPPPPLPK